MSGGGVSPPPDPPSFEWVDDVEDFLSTNEGEDSLPWDMFRYVMDYVQRGNRAFRENRPERFEEAINCYSRANNVKPSDPVILGNRCVANIRLSLYLRHRSATDSEYKALNGLDPIIHAELALKDAEKVLSLRANTIRSYILKANALVLVEKYEGARETILSGLQIEPFSNPLHALLRKLERTHATVMGRRSRRELERTDDFDCVVCLKLLYEPITTPCGHSFCRSCLYQSTDRGNKCPLCRKVIYISPRTSSVNVILNNIIQRNFPEEYKGRKAEQQSLTNLGNDKVPLFVMDVVFPCQKLHLHIFEPRYRLMVRRIVEGNYRMGMAMLDPNTGGLAEYACEVEITECEPLPDGRFFIEVEGRRRFRIIRSTEQDGYRVADAEWVQDIPPDGTQARANLQELTNTVSEHTRAWLIRAKHASRNDRLKYEKYLSMEKMMPSAQDPERFSFWLMSLTNRRPAEKMEILRLMDTRERISRGLIYLRSAEYPCRPPQ